MNVRLSHRKSARLSAVSRRLARKDREEEQLDRHR
jgi:hypothetical protein